MINAHDASVFITRQTITLRYGMLAAALHGRHEDRFAVADIASADYSAPTPRDMGAITLRDSSHRTLGVIPFPPRHEREAEEAWEAIERARAGEGPDDPPVDAEPSPSDLSMPDPIAGLSFLAVALRRATHHWGSVCEIQTVHIRDGHEVAARSWRCQPPEPWGKLDDADDWLGAPDPELPALSPVLARELPALGAIWGDCTAAFGNLPLLAHDAQYTMTALRDAARHSGVALPECQVGSMLALSRHAGLPAAAHDIRSLTEALDLPFHPEKDCGLARAVAAVALEIAHRLPTPTTGATGLTDLHRAAGLMMGRVGGSGDPEPWPVLAIAASIDSDAPKNATSREKPRTQEARRDRRAPWERVAAPDTVPEAATDADPEGALYHQHVTLTGDFSPYDKGRLWDGIAERGGTVGKNVTKKTTLLVLGAWDKPTSKEKRARELIEQGQPIQIWQASQLYAELGLGADDSEGPPF